MPVIYDLPIYIYTFFSSPLALSLSSFLLFVWDFAIEKRCVRLAAQVVYSAMSIYSYSATCCGIASVIEKARFLTWKRNLWQVKYSKGMQISNLSTLYPARGIYTTVIYIYELYRLQCTLFFGSLANVWDIRNETVYATNLLIIFC